MYEREGKVWKAMAMVLREDMIIRTVESGCIKLAGNVKGFQEPKLVLKENL